MKTSLKALLGKSVEPWLFVLTCMLLAAVVVTAKLMADEVVQEEVRAIEHNGFDPG